MFIVQVVALAVVLAATFYIGRIVELNKGSKFIQEQNHEIANLRFACSLFQHAAEELKKKQCLHGDEDVCKMRDIGATSGCWNQAEDEP